jgi:hypothetical protein
MLLHVSQGVVILCLYLWTWLSLTIKSEINGSSLCISSVILCVTVTCVYCAVPLLGAFTKLWKATVGFVMSVCPHGTTRLPLDGVSLNLMFEDFSKICWENSNFFNLQEPCVLYIGWAYRYPPDVAFYIFSSTTVSTEYFEHAARSPFFSSKCCLFHNANFFGSCIIHILHTGCAKI